ncbi:hypothetical protein EPIR_3620 [Erwinia piriflorinigrans CFBP 5888]|uniref:Uncharacterized protein n=1 Tax=Erwinia piriflorinigrans CFBP 5888 TaxID=1161919 RepID=V5ZCA0_9GAMM|nr:hypothetical protein EPIR_3620 [Erwinia piriflorinigrans CFBP 5888]
MLMKLFLNHKVKKKFCRCFGMKLVSLPPTHYNQRFYGLAWSVWWKSLTLS